MTEGTARVTMLWSPELKERVREKVGTRGLTKFTVEAVEQHLAGVDKQRELESELSRARHAAQILADRVAMSGGREFDAEQALMDAELPHWLDTTGWPTTLAALVGGPEVVEPVAATPSEPEPSTPEKPESVVAPEGGQVEPDKAVRPQMQRTPPQRVEGEKPVSADLPHDVQHDDFLARVQAKAAEKGVDLMDAGLKPASSLSRWESKPEEEAPAEPERGPTQVVVADPVNPDACPKCGDELIGGECWTCM